MSHFDINPAELIVGLQKNRDLLARKNNEYLRFNQQWAEAKEIYSVALQQKLLSLRAKGEPVSIVKDLAKGDRNVASLEKNMIVAEGIMKACQQSMSDLRSEQDAQRSLLSWLKAEMQSQ
jgi:hypothetical protein